VDKVTFAVQVVHHADRRDGTWHRLPQILASGREQAVIKM